MTIRCRRLWAAGVVLAGSLASPATGVPHAWAAAPAGVSATRSMRLDVSAGRLIRLAGKAGTVFVADPSIADVQTPTPSSIFVFGKKPGRTTLFALAPDGSPLLAYALDVGVSERALRTGSAAEAGDAPVALDYDGNGALLQGTVPNAGAAERLQKSAALALGPNVPMSNQLRVNGPEQVNLRVRVAEVSRSVSRQLGFNWATIFSVGSFVIGLQTGRLAGSGTSLIANGVNGVFGSVNSSHVSGSTVLDAMASEGLVTMLAEPNLTAISGATATFLAGGEFPIPVPQALGVTSIEYKQYGVSVAFTPTVLSTGRISMKVRPEVSALDTAASITLNNVQVPALTTRRAETTVDLASGQSFAIAGLIQNNASNNVQKVPWLGDLPVLGTLFRSNQFQRNETELVIVVTPYVVQPVDAAPVDANGHFSVPSDLEELLYGRVARRGNGDVDPVAAPRLAGSAGFLFE